MLVECAQVESCAPCPEHRHDDVARLQELVHADPRGFTESVGGVAPSWSPTFCAQGWYQNSWVMHFMCSGNREALNIIDAASSTATSLANPMSSSSDMARISASIWRMSIALNRAALPLGASWSSFTDNSS